MQTLQFVLLQMDDAARHIRDGRLSQLRIALLLLDNAAEVLLHQWAEGQLVRDAMTRRLRENARRWRAPESLLDGFDLGELLPPAEERRVLRLFDRLLTYAVLKRVVEPEIAEILGYLHRYRNEAYHRARVREATISTSVTLLFDIVARFVSSDLGHVHMYSSGEDYSWLSDRFALSQRQLFPADELRGTAIAQLRASLPASASDIPGAMAAHLVSRVDDLFDALDFIRESARNPISRAQALSQSYGYIESQQSDAELRDRTPPRFTGDMPLETTEQVRQAAEVVRRESDVLAAFRTFASAEGELEHLEFAVFEFAAAVDGFIQQQIDIARGK